MNNNEIFLSGMNDELTRENARLQAENEQLKSNFDMTGCICPVCKEKNCHTMQYLQQLKAERQEFTDWLLQENSKVVNFEVSKFILSCANQLRKGVSK